MIKSEDVLVKYVYSRGVVIGIKIQHVKSNISVECTKHSTDHRNRVDCMRQLEAKLKEQAND